MSKLLVGTCGSSHRSIRSTPVTCALAGPGPEQLLRAAARAAVVAAGHHLDPAVGEVARVPGEAERPRVPGDEPAEPDALHLPRDQERAPVIAAALRGAATST